MKLYVVVERVYVDGRLDETQTFRKACRSADAARSEIEEACREMWESMEYEGEDLELNPYEPPVWSDDRLTANDRENRWDDWTEWSIHEVEAE